METSRLRQKLIEQKRWDLLAMFDHGISALGRQDLIRSMLKHAVERFDEDLALKLFQLIQPVIEDELVALDAMDTNSLDHVQAEAQRRTRENTTMRLYAASAIKLWRMTPAHAEGRWINRETCEEGRTKEPTLIKYKQKLLEVAIQRWRDTNDDKEAETLFGYFIEVFKRDDPGGMEMLVQAFRETKDQWAQRSRTMKGIMRFMKETRYDRENDPARTLWISMVRDLDRQDLMKIGAVIQHLPLSRPGYHHGVVVGAAPLINAVARDTEAYAAMHDAMSDLARLLKPQKGEIRTFEPSYPRIGNVDLSIGATSSWAARGSEENRFHDIFADLRDQVRAWMDARKAEKKATPLIALRVYWPVQYGEPTLVRQDELRP